MSEQQILRQIRQYMQMRADVKMWRANVGKHQFKVSLPVGFPDLFGYRTVEITPEMVGKKIAQFIFVEVKTLSGKVSEKQASMHKQFIEDGADGIVAHSIEEVKKLVEW